MHRPLLLLAAVLATAGAADVWVGLRSLEYNDDGKIYVNYAACQLSEADLELVRSGKNPDGFVEARNVMFIDSDAGTYEMNSENRHTKEESDTILYRINRIHQVILLKDDPRRIYRKFVAEEPEKGAEKPSKAGDPGKW